MSYSKPYSLNVVPGGDTVRSSIQTKVDGNITAIFANLNTHEALSEIHGATGAIVGTTNTQTLTNKTLSGATLTGCKVTNEQGISGTISGTDRNLIGLFNTTQCLIGATAGFTDVKIYAGNGNAAIAIDSANAITLAVALAVASGGTGATSAGAARTNLGLGSIATQASSNVSITGGTIAGVNLNTSTVTGGNLTSCDLNSCNIVSLTSPLSATYGGTGAAGIPVFSSGQASSNLNLGTSYATIEFNTAYVDTHSGLYSGWRYTIPTGYGGTWLFSWSFSVFGPVGNIVTYFRLKHASGSDYYYRIATQELDSAYDGQHVAGSLALAVSAGDQITLEGYGSSTGAYIAETDGCARFNGFRLGP